MEENQLVENPGKISENLLDHINDPDSLAMQLIFDNGLYNRTRGLAKIMAKAQGITPEHLLGKEESCYAIVTRSIMWGLDPFAVAPCTYEVKGKVGYEGKLCHAILEKSNRFEGRIKYEMIGDWSKVQGKMKVANNGNGKFWEPDWKTQDEEGLGVRIIAKFTDEEEPEDFTFMLKQANPRNSTLWATDPVTQIKYLAIRRFANSSVPDIFMGVPFDREDFGNKGFKNVTPKSQKPRMEASDVTDILRAQTQNANKDVHGITEETTKKESQEPQERIEQSV